MRFSRIVLAILLACLALPANAADLWRPKGAPSFVDENGAPIAGKLCFYDAGTSSQRTVYKDSEGATPWTQPIELDSAGRLTDNIFVPEGEFKEVFKAADATTCSNGTTVFTNDNLPGAFDSESLSTAFAKPEQPTISKATSYTITTDDLGYIVNVNATGGAVTITLPTASSAGNGGIVTVRKVDSSANAVTINVTGAATIDGSSSLTLSRQYDRMAISSDGANWNTLHGLVDGTVTFGKLASTAYSTDGTFADNSATKLPTQSAVKTYVDTAVSSGIKWKDPVRVATTANGTLATAFDDASTVDGETLATGDRILIKNQSAPAENGIYVVQASGAPVRATDADTEAELIGATVFVTEGSANEGSQWTQTEEEITVDSTDVSFSLIASGITYQAGTGLDLTGSTFSVETGGITATQIATGAVGSDELASDSVGEAEIIADSVGTSEIAPSAVTTTEVADATLTATDMATTVTYRLLPAGVVLPYAGTTCPSGSLAAEGAAVSRSTYSSLFTALSTRYGVGNGSTTFNLPDYRGYFMRGWDHGAGVDPDAASRTDAGGSSASFAGDNVGSKQADQYKSHTHDFTDNQAQSNGQAQSGSGKGVTSTDTESDTTQSSGGNETRPDNINVLYCIATGGV